MHDTQADVQQRLYKLIALGGFALTAVLLLVALFDPELVFGSGMVLAITGTQYTSGSETSVGDATHRVPSVSNILTRIEPSSFPFTTIMDRLGKTNKAKQVVHKWGEVSRYARSDTVPSATTAGSAGASKTVGVSDGSKWRADDVFISLSNATDGAGAVLYWVVSVSSNDLTVRALPNSDAGTPYTGDTAGTVPAFAEGETIYWVANMKEERSTKSASRIIQPAYAFNFVQTEDQVVDFSDHKMRSENFGPKDVNRYRRDNLFEYMKNWEYSFLFNPRPSVVADPTSTRLRWVMGGCKYFLASTSITLATTGGIPTTSQGIDFVWACFDDNNGSREKLLVGGKDFMKSVDKISATDLRIRSVEIARGLVVQIIESRVGRLMTTYHPGFDEMGYADQAFCLDLSNIFISDYQPIERRILDFKKQGVDADGEQYIGKRTLEMRNTATHKLCALA